MFSAFVYGLDKEKAIMRISCSDTLVKQFGRDLVDIIRSEDFCDIFPDFASDPFFKKTEDEFQFKDSRERNFLCITRDSRIVGFRTNMVIEDDLIGGTKEALQDELHKRIIYSHVTDWTTRGKDNNLQVISIGTMFSPNDLLNWLKENAEKNGEPQDTPFEKFVEVYKNNFTGKLEVFITIPALDENEQSTLECEFPTNYFLKKKDELLSDKSGDGEYQWQSVFMQNPVPPTGLDFSYTNLQTYENPPNIYDPQSEFSPYTWAVIDPQRKGKNFIAMPIFAHKLNDDSEHYLIDALFRKQPMMELYDDIVQKVIKYKIRKLWIETNTDTSLPALLEAKIEQAGGFCEIISVYTLQNKEQKIKDEAGYIKKSIIFPQRNKLENGSDLKVFMEQLTSYSFERANKFDDAPDSLAIYMGQNKPEFKQYAQIQCFDRRLLGF